MVDFEPIRNWPEIIQSLETFIQGSVKELGARGAVLGVSGGIDSAVVAALAVRALGPDRVQACLLPDTDSGDDMPQDAKAVVEWLGIQNVFTKDITPVLRALGAYDLFPELYALSKAERRHAIADRKRALLPAAQSGETFLEGYRQKADPVMNRIRSFWNMKIRCRMVILYAQAELHKLIVLGTTNRSEYLTGFFTKYGDGAVDAEVILPLYKRRVFELAEQLDVPAQIRAKVPTGDILPGVSDEELLGVSYPILDRILLGLDRGLTEDEIAREIGVQPALARHVSGLIASSRFSRAEVLTPPVSVT